MLLKYEREIGNGGMLFTYATARSLVSAAVEELKVLAAGIIESNENDGVARWFKEHAVIEY